MHYVIDLYDITTNSRSSGSFTLSRNSLPWNCLQSILPEMVNNIHNTRKRGHSYSLDKAITDLYSRSFLPRCPIAYVWLILIFSLCSVCKVFTRVSLLLFRVSLLLSRPASFNQYSSRTNANKHLRSIITFGCWFHGGYIKLYFTLLF